MLKRVEEGSWKDLYAWFFGAAERWPDVFDPEQLHTYQIQVDQRVGSDRELGARYLRTALLKLLYRSVRDCTACPLAANRLKNTPVLDDGDPEADLFAELDDERLPLGPNGAEIMIVGEGPGEYEQRTGLPLVSFQSLHGSRCARSCAQFERCYPVPEKRGFEELKPAQPCRPQQLLKVLNEAPERIAEFYPDLGSQPAETRLDYVRELRASRGYYPLNTCGELIDILLVKELPWAWRQSWNARVRMFPGSGRTEREGTVYVTNAVKCRACTAGENRTPSLQEMEACRRYLEMQIYIVQPKVLVALGKPALYALSGRHPDKVKITSEDEWGPVQASLYGIPLIAAPHPSWAKREPSRIKDYKARLVQNLQQAKQIADGELELLEPWSEAYNLRLRQAQQLLLEGKLEEARELCRSLPEVSVYELVERLIDPDRPPVAGLSYPEGWTPEQLVRQAYARAFEIAESPEDEEVPVAVEPDPPVPEVPELPVTEPGPRRESAAPPDAAALAQMDLGDLDDELPPPPEETPPMRPASRAEASRPPAPRPRTTGPVGPVPGTSAPEPERPRIEIPKEYLGLPGFPELDEAVTPQAAGSVFTFPDDWEEGVEETAAAETDEP